MSRIAAWRLWWTQRVAARGKTLSPRPGECANCGTPVDDAYCPHCGQETAIALPTARAFLREAAGRYVAFDGRLWRTLGALFTRPGYLTREYLAGRRRRYVRPGRLFLVLSLALFAVLRFTAEPSMVFMSDGQPAGGGTAAPVRNDASSGSAPLSLGVDDDFNLTLGDGGARWLAPVQQRLNAFNGLSRKEKTDQILAGMLRYGPYAIVALLPVFAALMKLAYLGRTRRHPQRPRGYAAHLVFGAHDHAFLLLALIAYIVVPFEPARAALQLWIWIYLPWSMRVVYGGGWAGIVVRALGVAVAYLFCFALACAVLVAVAVALR